MKAASILRESVDEQGCALGRVRAVGETAVALARKLDRARRIRVRRLAKLRHERVIARLRRRRRDDLDARRG